MEWKLLDKLCEINIGKTPPRKNLDYWGKGSKWIAIGDMGDSKFISETKEEITKLAIEECNMDKKLVPKGTVIMSFKLSIGKVAITSEDMYTNEAIASFVIKDKELLDTNYLYYALQTLQLLKTADRAVMGATLNKTKLKKIEIPVPQIEIQQKIADTLDKAQQLIDKRREQLEKLDEFVESVFLDMFGDPFVNSKGWEIKEFDYFAEIDNNRTDDFEEYKDLPHIGVGNIEKNMGKLIDYNLVKDEGLTSSKYLFTGEHIIYSKIRPNLNKVALPDFEGLCSADAYPLLVNKDHTNKYFFAYMLRSEFFLNYILKYSTRTNIPKANQKQLRGFECMCPPLELQNKFAQIVEVIEEKREILEESLAEMENNFNSIMQKAFKGELF